ncbi:uncharacterized protein E5676_scaffold1228G00240 [Cucumis melo var. makuwa]|uniref:Putative plant transposon protein domain-containing protein n=1 Tax=Cucumis melo var. makuwa TaxID=1194695 RepID=A0A5D3E0B7_CUCMM|nr:uncharacterized protein E5676_scaffold1228G00240 [Cucumis melo var. makuwa]
MVNTRRGKYQSRSTQVILEVSSSDHSNDSLHDSPVTSNIPEHVVPLESHLSDMDSDERDDVPLVHILKRLFRKPSQPFIDIFGSSAAHRSSHVLILILPVKGPQVVTTKTGRRKLPLSIPSVPLMEFRFISRRVFKGGIVKASLSKTISNVDHFYPRLIREFIVKLPSEFNDLSSPDYQTVHIRGSKFKISPYVINSFLGNTITSEFQVSHPSNNELAFVLSDGTLLVWFVNGIPLISLSAKFEVLHKIGIANWFPSSHASSISAALAIFLYQICNDASRDAGLFIYNQLLRHVGSFGIKIPIALPRFFSSLLLHLNPNIFTEHNAPGPDSKTLSLSYRLFQGNHVLDIDHGVSPSRNPRTFDIEDVNISLE